MCCHHPSLSRHITSIDWQEVTTHSYINLFHTLCSKSRDPGWWAGYGSVTTELPNAPKLHLTRKSQWMASLHGFNGWKRVTHSNYPTKRVNFWSTKFWKSLGWPGSKALDLYWEALTLSWSLPPVARQGCEPKGTAPPPEMKYLRVMEEFVFTWWPHFSDECFQQNILKTK